MRDAFDYLNKAYGFFINGLLCIGANEGQERQDLYELGTKHAIFVEPLPSVFKKLEDNLSSYPFFIARQAVCSDFPDQVVNFHVTSNGDSSSLLKLGKHKELFPDIVQNEVLQLVTTTVDRLVAESGKSFNTLVMDVQGAELKVIAGAKETLKNIDAVFLEVFQEPLYEGSAVLDDVFDFFKNAGFRVVWLQIGRNLFGDAMFLKTDFLTRANPTIVFEGINVALNKPAQQSSLSPWSSTEGAQGANNGHRTGGFGIHTALEYEPWWEVDLQNEYPISHIAVFNRIDACHHRAKYLQVFLIDKYGNKTLVHDCGGRPFGGVDGNYLNIKCNNKLAQRVRIQLAAKDILHLDEVEIYIANM